MSYAVALRAYQQYQINSINSSQNNNMGENNNFSSWGNMASTSYVPINNMYV